MSEVWCIVSGRNADSHALAEWLLRGSNRVAVITADASPFALLVNEYGDRVVSAEIREPDLLSLTEIIWAIEQNVGEVDRIALMLDDEGRDPAETLAVTEFFQQRWPDAQIVDLAPSGRR